MTLGRWKVFAAVGAALTLCATAGQLRAQGGTVTGKVTTVNGGNPLAETRVLVLGTSVSATTGEDGSFTLRNVPAGTAQLQALRVGYRSEKQTATVTAGATVTANFSMTVAVAQLDEVVTTATGQQRRVEIGNAVATLGDVSSTVEQSQVRDTGQRSWKATRGRASAAAEHDGRRACHSHPRPFVDQPVERADLDRRRHSLRRRRRAASTRRLASRCSTRSRPKRSRTSRS